MPYMEYCTTKGVENMPTSGDIQSIQKIFRHPSLQHGRVARQKSLLSKKAHYSPLGVCQKAPKDSKGTKIP